MTARQGEPQTSVWGSAGARFDAEANVRAASSSANQDRHERCEVAADRLIHRGGAEDLWQITTTGLTLRASSAPPRFKTIPARGPFALFACPPSGANCRAPHHAERDGYFA